MEKKGSSSSCPPSTDHPENPVNLACYNPAMQPLRRRSTGFALALILLVQAAACSPQAAPLTATLAETLPAITLSPYIQDTKTPTPEPSPGGTPTPLPSPSPTPIMHTVTAGESFGTIAVKYGITVDALIIANPTVNPNAIPVGTVLNIPSAPAEGSPANVLPTPISVSLQTPACYQDTAWRIICFLDAANPSATPIEGVSATLRYLSADGSLKEAVAYSLLNRIPVGGAVPLYAVFPADKTWNGSMDAELRSAIPSLAMSSKVEISGTAIKLNAEGSSARVTGMITAGDADAGEYWVLLIGRNGQGQITAARRFSVSLPDGETSAEFSFQVYSLSGVIETVDVLAEPAP